MINMVKKHYSLIITLGVLWTTVAMLVFVSIRNNQGYFVYALDDPYIHMSIAKTFSQHAVWGVNKYHFASATSSPLWTLLISLIYFLFGANELSPFILNMGFATLLILGIYILLRKHTSNTLLTLIILLSIVFFTPLPPLMFTGQEHTMHTLITILFVYLSAKILSDERPALIRYFLLLVLGLLLALTRYESLLLILVVCFLFVLRRRFLHSMFLGGICFLPIAIYGGISIANGWYFLPNPVLLKGNLPNPSSLSSIVAFFFYGCQLLVMNSHILSLLIGTLIIFVFHYAKHGRAWNDVTIMIAVYIAITLLHVQFARTGWFYRYEAYLMALGILIIGISLHEYLPDKLQFEINRNQMPKYTALALLVSLVILPFAQRGFESLKQTPQATTNIYEHQYQMGLFLRSFYQGEAVAANDIGAINYLADINCLDLVGLASMEVARAKKEGHYDVPQRRKLAKLKKTKIAIVDDSLADYFGGLPSEWLKVGEWRIPNNVVCADDTISFYAVDAKEADRLVKHLEAFSSVLPKDVAQTNVCIQ